MGAGGDDEVLYVGGGGVLGGRECGGRGLSVGALSRSEGTWV